MSKAGILIVEDSFIVAYHLQATLENEGYRIVGKCDSGEAALKVAETEKPDLAFMDIMLTGEMDGIQTAGILKSKFDIPVIYITALTDKDTIGRAKITEPYGYLNKPFEDREIFTAIEMALYKHSIESMLRRSEEKYFSTVNSISDAVVTIDRDYVISYMNPSAVALTQWSLPDSIGKPITEVLRLRNEGTDEIGVNPIQCAIGMGNHNRMPEDLVLIGKHGEELPIGESSLSPLLDNRDNFIGLIIVFKDTTEKREHKRLMEQIEKQRMAALIEGQEKERSRIAKDLHDGLGQMLNAIKMNMSIFISELESENNLSKLLDEAIQESVRISENLLPAKLRDFDLATCLRSFCTQMRNSTRSNVLFEDHDSRSGMSQFQKVNFYRITQEAVNNAIKHACADSITVQLSEANDFMRLSIEDDGAGISSDKTSLRRNGLVNMRERAEIMGGKFTIESDPLRGTIVIVEVPTSNLVLNVQV